MSQVRYYVVLEKDAQKQTIFQTTAKGKLGDRFTFVYGYETDWEKACDLLHKQNKSPFDDLICRPFDI